MELSEAFYAGLSLVPDAALQKALNDQEAFIQLYNVAVQNFAGPGVKDALGGKKYENSDEFLVIKKNPLVLPPNFNELPTPKDVADTTQIENIENEIEDLLSSIKDNEEVLSSLKISFDGSIMAVKKSCVEDHYIDQNVKMIKAGYESLPKREKGFKINDSETLYKVLSFYVEI